MSVCTIMLRRLSVLLSVLPVVSLYASKLAEFSVIDRNVLMVKMLDGEVTHRDDGIGPQAFTNNYHEDDIDTVKRYTPEMSTSAAQQPANWTLSSSDDVEFADPGVHPTECYRKTKLNGHAEQGWRGSDFIYESTYEHTLYLVFSEGRRANRDGTISGERDAVMSLINKVTIF